MALNILTLAVVDVDYSVPIAQSLGEAADEALGALGCGVDANQVEGTFGSRHGGEIGRVITYKNATVAGGFILFIPQADIGRARHFPTLWDAAPPAYTTPG